MAFLTRRKFLKAGSAAAAGGALAVAADGVIFQPNRPRLIELEIRLRRLPAAFDGFRIAQLSDFHYDPHFSAIPIRKGVAVVNRLHPDLVVLTGDFVSQPVFGGDPSARRAAGDIDPCAKLLRALDPSLITLAILGNHDCATDAERITRTLEAHGFPVLNNRSVPLERGGSRLGLQGLRMC